MICRSTLSTVRTGLRKRERTHVGTLETLMKYAIDPDAGVIYGVAQGEVSVEEYTAFLDAVVSDPAYQPSFTWIYDVTDAQTPSGEFVREIARVDASRGELFGGTRQAIVVSSEAQFGMARMYEILVDELPGPRQVCRSLDEAREWLGLPEDWTPPAV